MKVLFINQYYPPDAAASSYLLGELAEDLAEFLDVVVVAGTPSYNPEGSSYEPRGVVVNRAWSTTFSRRRMLGRLVNYATFLIGALFRAFRTPRPDVIVAFTDPPVIGFVGALVATAHRRPFIQVYQDVYPDVALALAKFRNPLAVWVWRRLNALCRRRAHRVVVVGRDMQQKLNYQGVRPDKISFIPNWGPETRPDLSVASSLRSELGWEGHHVIMHAGNVGLAQNLGTLVTATERLQSDPDILVVVLGDGAAKHGLQQRSEALGLRNLLFLPYRPKDQAQAFILAADVHVISLVRGMWGCAVPSKMYNVMSAGKPFVAAVEPGSEPACVIEDYKCGVRVDPGDSDALAVAIRSLRGEPAEAMGARGRLAFEDNFTRRGASTSYREIIEAVAETWHS